MGKVISHSLLTDYDINLFKSGKHFKLYEKLGSKPLVLDDGTAGVLFAVWAPNASYVSVMGDFNNWNRNEHPLNPRWDGSGIWEGFIPEAKTGQTYKYFIHSANRNLELEKGDPFALSWEEPPKTGSRIVDLSYQWSDGAWMKKRATVNALDKPISVYEVHIGSWRRNSLEEFRSLTYRELAVELVEYVVEMGFTHVELMPVMEHPFFGSWGYQITGYFAPSSRFGTPQDFMFLIDSFHKAGIGVYLDWVPSHFPGDAHGLFLFDGTHLYEHANPQEGYHPDWSSYIFNYGRNEVRAFLISNAAFWLDLYHADGLRVDAVASMLFRDYSRKAGEWVPNVYGGRENLEAISLLKELNEHAYGTFPEIQMIAEESTSWPKVSRPLYDGGLGFGMKWMMGWMNDVLVYFKRDPMFRRWHQNEMTFSMVYAFTENFMLPLSHDEVVHGKGSLLARMPGDAWQKFANLRVLFGWMYTHPGTKLLFMGSELAQPTEWKHDESLHWHLTDGKYHKGMQDWVKALNKLYTSHKELHELNFSPLGFEWIDYSDNRNCVLVFERKAANPSKRLMVVMNLTPIVHQNYRVGSSVKTGWTEILNSDDIQFGGSGQLNTKRRVAENIRQHNREYSVEITLPPLGIAVFKPTTK